MSELEEMYRKHHKFFGSDSHAYLIFATFNSRPTSPEQTAILRERLGHLRIPLVSDTSYERPPQMVMNDYRPEGTLLVEKKPNTRPTVYLEDRVVSPNASSMAAGSAQASSSRSSSSQAANVPQNSPQGRANTYWTHFVGSKEYVLYNESRHVLQQSHTPPRGVPVHIFDSNGKHVKMAVFDGQKWLE